MTKKITIDDIVTMFGGDIPMEAIQFVFVTAPPDMTLREVRNELEEMADRHRAKRVEDSCGCVFCDLGLIPISCTSGPIHFGGQGRRTPCTKPRAAI